HVDDPLEAKLCPPKLFRVGPDRKVELSARYGRHAGRGAADGDSLDIFERETDSFEGQPQSEVRRSPRYMHGCGSPFEIFRRLNLALAKHVIIQRLVP